MFNNVMIEIVLTALGDGSIAGRLEFVAAS